jgi:DNA polymerase III epsilon subunit-like protein
MKNQEYAIVDIETTGGNATHSRITEIAIGFMMEKRLIVGKH